MAPPAITSTFGSTGRQSFMTPSPATSWVNPDVTLPATAGVSSVNSTQVNRWSDVAGRVIVVTQNSGVSVVAGAYYGIGFSGSAVDFSADDGAVIELDLVFSGMTPLDTTANNGLSAILATQNGGWQHFSIGGNDLNTEDSISEIHGGTQQGQALILAPGGDPNSLIAENNFSNTNINYVGLFFRYAGSTTSGSTSYSFLQSVAHATYKIIQGEVANPARLKVISDLEANTASLGTASFVRAGQSQYVSYRSISIGDGSSLVYFVETFSLEFAPANTKSALFQVPDGYLKFKINLTDTSTCIMAGSRISSGRGLTFQIVRIGAATTDFDRLTLNGGAGRGTVILNADYSQTLGLFSSLSQVYLNGASLNNVTLSDIEQVNLTPADIFSGNYQDAPATGAGVILSGPPGSYSTQIAFDNNASTADLTINPTQDNGSQAANLYTFGSLSRAAGYTVTLHNASVSIPITVAVPAGFSVDTTGSPGSISITQPQPTLTIQGVPAGGIFTIWDDEVADPQDLGTALQTTDPTTGGDISYIGTAGNNLVLQFVPNTGASASYKELNYPITFPNQSQALDLSQNLELEDGL